MDRTPATVTRQIGGNATSVRVARHHPHMPVCLLMTEAIEEVEKRLRAHLHRQREVPTMKVRRRASSSWPRNTAMPPRPGSRYPFRTAPQWPSGVRPPPVTRPWRCGCSTNVCPHVCRAAIMPGRAPRYVCSPSNSKRVSRTAANSTEVVSVTLPSHKALRSWGVVKIS